MNIDRHTEIEEMAEIISAVRFHKTSTYIAEALYNAGYRKASEVSREIFEEIEKILVRPEAPTALFYHCSKHSYAELKKKYTESEKDNG